MFGWNSGIKGKCDSKEVNGEVLCVPWSYIQLWLAPFSLLTILVLTGFSDDDSIPECYHSPFVRRLFFYNDFDTHMAL